MIKRAWRWYSDEPGNEHFVDILMELEDGSLCALTYGDLLVFDGQKYLAGRVHYDLHEQLRDTKDQYIWRRIL